MIDPWVIQLVQLDIRSQDSVSADVFLCLPCSWTFHSFGIPWHESWAILLSQSANRSYRTLLALIYPSSYQLHCVIFPACYIDCIVIEFASSIVFSSFPLLTMTTDIKRGTLTIAGSGIACIAHITLETLSYIKESDKLFYLVCDPVTEAFIQDNATGGCFDLSVFYDKNKSRYDSYIQMCEVRTVTCFNTFCTLLIRNQGRVESCQGRSRRPWCILWTSWSFCIPLSQGNRCGPRRGLQGQDAPWNFRRGLLVCRSRIWSQSLRL